MIALPSNKASLLSANNGGIDWSYRFRPLSHNRCRLAYPLKYSRCGRSVVRCSADIAVAQADRLAQLHIGPGAVPMRISKSWMEYQGSKNWEGLLHPLDHNLRHEILRYGEFVEAAYRAFDFEPESRTFAACKYPFLDSLLTRSGIRETGYQVTKNLWATCGVRLPQWMEKMPSWMSIPSSWIGYVAVCQDEEEILRLGRRDIVIAFRGTATCLEWIENLRASLTGLQSEDEEKPNDGPMVQSGFLSLYTSGTSSTPSLRDTIREEITRILRTYDNQPLSITITGHSLGAALATLAAYDIRTSFSNAPMVTVVSFGGPRVGDMSFRSCLEESGTKILRIVNSDDVVTKMPGFVLEDADWRSKNIAVQGMGISGWFQKSVEDMWWWVYADVGQELRLSSRMSPYHSKGNMATCHELKTYLQLVRGFVSCRDVHSDQTAMGMLKLNSPKMSSA